VQTSLGRSEDGVEWGTPAAVLVTFAEELATSGVPLCTELAEMIHVDGEIVRARDLGSAPLSTDAVAELLGEPMTAAETASTLFLATVAARARDAGLDDECLLRVMAQATKIVSRFESYVAERAPLHLH
jgi:hypothetical protein